MTAPTSRVSRTAELSAKVAQMMQRRLSVAQEHFTERARKAYETYGKPAAQPKTPMDMWTEAASYAVDFAQRSLLFWDTMRQRGNVFVERTRAGLPPVPPFHYEMVMDGTPCQSRSIARWSASLAAPDCGLWKAGRVKSLVR